MLKTIAIIAILLLSPLAFAQTSVISTKSHHGQLQDLSNSNDNFGEREVFYPPNSVQVPQQILIHSLVDIETLTKIDDHCVIRKGLLNERQYSDTLCNFWYYEEHNYNKQSMRDFHGPDVILIGFPENAPTMNKNDAPFSGRTSRFGVSWLFALLILGSLGGFVLFPKSKV